MANFKICVRKARKDGLYPVYIRITHNRAIQYMRTEKLTNNKGVLQDGSVCDPHVVKPLMNRIDQYIDILNLQDTRNWTPKQLVEYLEQYEEDLSFSEYARKHEDKMTDAGMVAKNYRYALNSLERYAGTTDIKFSAITSTFLHGWIESLSQTKRAKEMYPICMRQVFRAALKDFNDYDTGVMRIRTNPWMTVSIPKADRPEKLAISPEACREFFSAPVPESKMKYPIPELGRDVAMMILCLAGINTVDIYQLRKEDYSSGIIRYKRAKTKKFRADEAYIEMRVPQVLMPVFDKYLSRDSSSPWLFDFHERMTTSDSFGANVNIGIRKMCESLGIPKDEWYCGYTFRHTWGTIAQNECGATIHEVAFAMNHAAGHEVTRGYLKLDFSPAWELNEKVAEYVFLSNKPSKRALQEQSVQENLRISPKYMIRGTMYYRGEMVYEVQQVGYNNKEEVIAELMRYIPGTVPYRSMLTIKVENLDRNQEAVYSRMNMNKG